MARKDECSMASLLKSKRIASHDDPAFLYGLAYYCLTNYGEFHHNALAEWKEMPAHQRLSYIRKSTNHVDRLREEPRLSLKPKDVYPCTPGYAALMCFNDDCSNTEMAAFAEFVEHTCIDNVWSEQQLKNLLELWAKLSFDVRMFYLNRAGDQIVFKPIGV